MAIISRRQYDHPALATAGGSALHAAIENLYTVLGNDSMSRYKTFTAVANSSVGVIAHEFGLDFANLKVQIFTGTYPALTLVSDPVGSGWTVAATSGLASRSIDVTAPASGGPHTYAVVVTHESNGSQYIPGLVSIGTQSFAGAKTFLTSTDTPISGITNYALFSEVAAPGTPVAGKVAIYAKTDKKMYRKGSDGVEAEIGSGSASGFINYILNADLEAGNTTGWATYKDAAAATPVDGTGGSPTTLTLTANGTTPLRGNFDLKIAKTGVNSQGEGFSYDFTIKSPDISKKLQVSFDLNTNDANYVSGDVVVYLYDVTNSTLITPSVTAIPKVGASTYSFTFDTTTSLSYRLIFHWATVNATASNIYLENFFVGPGSLVQGAAISEWNSYTPTLINGGTTSTNTGRWRRVGSSMEIQTYSVFTGAGTAGVFSVSLPTGFNVDTSALPAGTNVPTQPLGIMNYNNATTVAYYSSYFQTGTTPHSLKFIAGGGSVAFSGVSIANTHEIGMQVKVPIAEWAGNGTANLGINPIQYLGNSNTSTSVNDTSAFTFGPAGNSIVAVSSTGVWVKKRVQLLQGNWSASGGTPIVKVSADGLLWLNAQDVFPPLKSAGLFYGIDIQVSGVNTVDVAFGGDGASTGAAWSTVTSYKWRVDVAVPGQAVGFGIADTNASGLIPSGVYNNTTQAWTIGSTSSVTHQFIVGSNKNVKILSSLPSEHSAPSDLVTFGTMVGCFDALGTANREQGIFSYTTIAPASKLAIISRSGLVIMDSSSGGQVASVTANAWIFGIAGSAVHLFNGSNVKILSSTSNSNLTMRNSTTGDAAGLVIQQDGVNCNIYNNSNGYMELASNSVAGIRIASTGACTFGPTAGSSLDHILRSNGSTRVSIQAAAASTPYIDYRIGGTQKWEHGVGNNYGTDSFYFYSHVAAAYVCGFTTAGAFDFGTTSTGASHFFRNSFSGYTGAFRNSSGTPYGISIFYTAITSTSSSDYWYIDCSDQTNQKFVVYSNGDTKNRTGVYGTLSDERIKQDIVDATAQTDDFMLIKFRKYRLKDDVLADNNAPHHLGVIAQELAETSPGLVDYNSGRDEYSVKTSILLLKAAKALQETIHRVDSLEAIIEALQS
jgi:hypothetical protein